MSTFEISRATTVAAQPATLHALVSDFHAWTAWSPWEDTDPNLVRTYSGPDAGVGAHYAWAGNRRAGRGSMEIVSSTPTEIGVRLAFEKPFRATNHVTFTFVADGAGATEVTWRMTGQQQGAMALFGRFVPMDRLVGKDFEKGLARLKAVAEV